MQRIMSILAYFSWLCIIPIIFILVAEKDDLVKAHVNNGLLLAIVTTIFSLIAYLTKDIAVVGNIFSIVNTVVWIAAVIFAIIGIAYAITGNKNKLPIIGGIRIIK